MNRTPRVDPSDYCVVVRDSRSRGEALSPEAAEHAEGCPVCRADPESLAASPWDPEAEFASLATSLSSEQGLLGRLRETRTTSRLLAATGVAFLVLAGVGFVTPRSRIAPMPVTRVVLVVSVLSVLFALGTRLVLRPMQSPPPSRRVLSLALLGGLLAPFLFAAVSTDSHAAEYSASALRCFLVGGALGAGFVGLLYAFDRGELASSATGPIAAVAGGLGANAALELHCASSDPVHLMLGHATIGVALLLLFAARSARARS
jgi:hypothetical protein